MRTKVYYLLLILPLAFFSACQAAAAQPTSTSEIPVDPQVSSALTDFGGSVELELSFQTLFELIRDNPSALAQAAMQQLEAADPGVRFAAIYALANTAETELHLDALHSLLASPDAGEQLLAAAALLVRGEKDAIPVLIAALDSAEDLPYSLPARQAWQLASAQLLLYTLEDFGLSQADSPDLAAAAQAEWQAWWDENGANLQWIAEEGVYR